MAVLIYEHGYSYAVTLEFMPDVALIRVVSTMKVCLFHMLGLILFETDEKNVLA
jgi:hypothetical protein